LEKVNLFRGGLSEVVIAVGSKYIQRGSCVMEIDGSDNKTPPRQMGMLAGEDGCAKKTRNGVGEKIIDAEKNSCSFFFFTTPHPADLSHEQEIRARR
jgi:hypothetical protein